MAVRPPRTSPNGRSLAGRLAVVYVADANYAGPTCASVHSLSAASGRPLDIYVLCHAIPVWLRRTMERSLAGLPENICLIEMREADLNVLPKPPSLPMTAHGCLLIDRYVPARYERLLYLDGDTLVHVDVTPLAGLAMGGHLLAAVLDFGRDIAGKSADDAQRLDFTPQGRYFNSGVMLLDYQHWRDSGVGQSCREALIQAPGRFEQGDQCVLNHHCRGQWLPLQARWNYQGDLINLFPKQQAIHHFIGARKPWSTHEIRYRISAVRHYQEFYLDTPLPKPHGLHAQPNSLVALRAWLRTLKPGLLGRRYQLWQLLRHYNRSAVL